MSGIAVLGYLLIVSIYDIRERSIPLMVLIIGGSAAMLRGIYGGITGELAWLQLLFGMLPGGFMLLLSKLTQKAGEADGLVLLFLGISYGYKQGLVLLCVSLLLLTGVVIVLLLFRKVKPDTQMPYLPFLTVAYLFCKWL